MANSDSFITDYAQILIDTPRAHLKLKIVQDNSGLKITHNEQLLIQCYLTVNGMAAGNYVAKAFGTQIPALGDSKDVRVSSGVLYRAIAIADLDFKEDASLVILNRLLEEADIQRGGISEIS